MQLYGCCQTIAFIFIVIICSVPSVDVPYIVRTMLCSSAMRRRLRMA